MDILERIKTDTLSEEDNKLIDEWESDFIQLAEYREYLYGPFREEMAQKHLRDLRQEVQQKLEKEVEKRLEEKIVLAHQQGLDKNLISTIFQIPIENIAGILAKHT